MKFAAQKTMTTRTPASAIRRSRELAWGRRYTGDEAESGEDVKTPAGLPAGVVPVSRGGGASI
jgi:hypothetical protein